MLLRLAWRNIWRQRRRTLITVSAMAFGVAFCMASIALDDWLFGEVFEILVTRNLGHVQVHAPAFPAQRALNDTIADVDALVARLDALAGATAVTPRLFGYALLAVGDEAAGGQLIGVVPEREHAATGVGERLQQGRFLGAAAGREIVLGAGLAETLRAAVGSEVVAVTQAADGSLGNELFRVAGIVKTDSVVVDRAGAFVHLADARELLALPGQAHELALLARDREAVPALAAAGRAALVERGLLVRSWDQIQPQLASMLQLTTVVNWIFLIMIFSVAALGVLNTMLMSVFERTQELGVLRALGLRPDQMIALVMLESVLLALLAVVAGGLFGAALDAFLVFRGIDLSWLSKGWSWYGARFPPVFHGVVRPFGVVAPLVGMVVIALLAALWPALRAAGLQPVEAMRQE